jgi:hypothetical protein
VRARRRRVRQPERERVRKRFGTEPFGAMSTICDCGEVAQPTLAVEVEHHLEHHAASFHELTLIDLSAGCLDGTVGMVASPALLGRDGHSLFGSAGLPAGPARVSPPVTEVTQLE